MSAQYFTSKQACTCLGVSERQLHHWDSRGIASPSLEPATGSGSRRRYSPTDVLRLLVVRELRALAVGLETIGRILADLAQLDLNCPESTVLVWDHQGVHYMGDEARQPVDARPATIHLGLGILAAELRRVIGQQPTPELHTEQIDGRRYQILITTTEAGLVAHCSAAGGVSATAATADDAVAQVLRLVKVGKPARTRRLRSKRAAPLNPSPAGAAAWGESW